MLEAVRDYKEVHVPACHDSTKTYTAARAALWFLWAHPIDSIVVTTAPTWHQVEGLLWKEVHSAFSHAKQKLIDPRAGDKLNQASLELGPKWYAVGRSTDDPVNMQGFHASNILVIVDEADGIPKLIWDAIDSVLTSKNSRLLAIGNPINPTSEWKKRHDEAVGDPKAKIIRISADDVLPYSDNFPFLLQQDWVTKRLKKWGPDSAMAQAKIFARWPTQTADTLIPISHLMRAVGRSVERGIRTLGVDVARYGGNRTVLTLLEGNQLLWSHAYDQQDTVQTASRVLSAMEQFGPAMTAIDETGIGGGVLDIVRSRYGVRAPVVGVNNGAQASDPDKFMNRGSEMWWKVRDAFEADKVGFSMDDPEAVDELIADLNRPTYTFQERTSKIRVDKFGHHAAEATMSVEERSEGSPDRGDSFVLAYCAAMPYIAMRQKSLTRSTTYLPRSAGAVNV